MPKATPHRQHVDQQPPLNGLSRVWPVKRDRGMAFAWGGGKPLKPTPRIHTLAAFCTIV